MRVRFLTSLFFTIFFGLSATYHTKAQITDVTYPATACTGQLIPVEFTVPVSAAPTTYSIRLIPAAGAAITLGTTAASPASVTIPAAGVPNGAYRIRVVAASPADSTTAAATLTISTTPSAPTVVTPVAACVGAPLALSAAGSNLTWYTGADALLPGPPDTAPATTGTHTYKVTQTTAGCESPAANITVNVSNTPAAPLVTTPVPACAGNALTLSATGTNLKWYSSTDVLLPAPPATAPATAGAHTYKVTQTTGGCESPAATITVNVTAAPAAPAVTTPVPACSGGPITLTATGTALKWYSATDVLLAGPPTNAPAASGTHTYKVSQTVGGCESPKATIIVNVAATPSAPAVTSPVAACAGNALTLTATGSNLKWYSAADVLLASPPATAPATTGTHTYKVSQTVGSCESPKASIVVNVAAIPTAPEVTTPVVVCAGSPMTLTASGSNLKWYSATDVLLAARPTTAPATAGTYTYKVSRTASGCESPTATITVNVTANPAAPVTTKLNACVGDTPQPVLTATGSNLKWYTTAGVSLASAPSIPTNAPATFSYQVSQTVDGCESPKASIAAQVYRTNAPTVVSSIAYCKDETPAALTATGTALKWYTAASGGTSTASPPTVSTATVGTVAYYVTQTLNGCESDRARIDVRTKAIPVAPTVANLADVCQSTTVPASQLLSAVTTATGTLRWYTAATGGTGTASAPAPVTTTSGIKNFYVTQSVEACESPRAAISLDVKALPAAPTATATVDFCHQATATQLTATPTAGNTLKWYTVATGGTALNGAPTPATTTVQTIAYYVSQSQTYSPTLACEGPRRKIDAVINPLPVNANTTDQVVCQTREDQNLNYSATATGATNTLLWFANASTTTSQTATPGRNLRTPGEFEYFVAQRSNKECVGPRKAVKIRVKRLPALPGVSNLEYCQFENAPALTASLETSATPNWYGQNATGGNRSSNAPVPSTADGGNFSYYVSQTLEACEGDRAEIRVLIKTTPKPETRTSISYCHNEPSSQLSANGQRLKWYRPNGESQDNPFTPFTASVGDQFFYVTQTGDNNCESPKEEIKITVYPLPSANISGQSSIPLGGTASIQISFTGLGPWSYTLSNGFTGTSESSTVSIQVQPAFTTSYLVTEVSNACGRGIPSGNAVVTVLRPTITTGNPSVVSICAGAELTVPFQRSGDFPSSSAFVLQLGKEDNDESYKSIPGTLSGNTIRCLLPDTLAGGLYYLRVISENQNPDLSTIGSTSGVNISVDPKPTATLPEDRAIFVGQSTTLSIALTGAAPWTFSYSDGVDRTSVTTSVTPYTLTVTPAQTTTYTVAEIENRCGVGRSIGETIVQVDPILGTEPTTANWVKVLPTVVNDACRVELEVADFDGIQLHVVDMSGRALRKMGLHQQVTRVDMGNLPSGIYFFQVTKQRRQTVIKVLKP